MPNNKASQDVIQIQNIIVGKGEYAYEGKKSIGIHPWYINQIKWKDDFLNWVEKVNNLVAIGECGLDKLSSISFDKQLEVFDYQIKHSNNENLPMIIHCVKAINECVNSLKIHQNHAIFHGINQKYNKVKAIIDAGHFVSFGHSLMNNLIAQNTFQRIPLECVFLETDDSDYEIEEIYKQASILKKLSMEELKLQLFSNYKKVFN